MFATLPDLLRLLAVPVFAWAALRDVRTRRLPNRIWPPLYAFGAVLLVWEGAALWPLAGFEGMRFAVRAAISVLFVAPLGYAFWYLGAFGGADAKALIALALLFPTFPEYARVGIPLNRTIGSTTNIVTTGLLVLVIPVIMGLLHPSDDIRELPKTTYEEVDQVVTEATYDDATDGGTPQTVADRLNDSRIIGLAIAIFPAFFVINAWFLRAGGISNLTLNSINALFLLLAVLLWVRPAAIVAQMKDSVSNISGIIFQFPFYAGIAGLLTGTGLATVIVEFFGAFATPATWPVIGVFVAGIVNVFIPSGGGQWVAMGPIMLDITTGFGYAPEQAIIIEMLGDQLTNMIQPFWAIPLLAIANLRARDIIGYTTVAMLVGLLIVCSSLTMFLVVL